MTSCGVNEKNAECASLLRSDKYAVAVQSLNCGLSYSLYNYTPKLSSRGGKVIIGSGPLLPDGHPLWLPFPSTVFLQRVAYKGHGYRVRAQLPERRFLFRSFVSSLFTCGRCRSWRYTLSVSVRSPPEAGSLRAPLCLPPRLSQK